MQVTAVADAAEALSLREAGADFDVDLSDIDMPGMDGFAFAQALRGGGPLARPPLVALTGRASPRISSAAVRPASPTTWRNSTVTRCSTAWRNASPLSARRG